MGVNTPEVAGQKRVKIFCCYAHEDEGLLKKLKGHLSPLQHQGLITVWHDRDISAGAVWEEEIKCHLNEAQIILLLISPDFMSSQYCYGVEMQHALERHKSGEATVIPVILRHTYWHEGPLSVLQALPTDGRPVTSREWDSYDAAFYAIVLGIRDIVETCIAKEEQLRKAEEAKQVRLAEEERELKAAREQERPPASSEAGAQTKDTNDAEALLKREQQWPTGQDQIQRPKTSNKTAPQSIQRQIGQSNAPEDTSGRWMVFGLLIIGVVLLVVLLPLAYNAMVTVSNGITRDLDINSLEAQIAQKYCDALKNQTYSEIFPFFIYNSITISGQTINEQEFIDRVHQINQQEGTVASCTLPKKETYQTSSCSSDGYPCGPDTYTLSIAITRTLEQKATSYSAALQISVPYPNGSLANAQIEKVDRI